MGLKYKCCAFLWIFIYVLYLLLCFMQADLFAFLVHDNDDADDNEDE